MKKLKFSEEELKQFPDLDEMEKELFTEKQIKRIHKRAIERSQVRRALSDSISKAVIAYMSHEKIGFNELTRRLHMSPATTSKILRGDANLTLDTISILSETIGKVPCISF